MVAPLFILRRANPIFVSMASDPIDRIKRYCAYQERCHSEVRNKLLELGFRGDDLEEVIVMLIAENFLNEERYARSFCRGKFKIKQWGRQKIIRSLKQKRISEYCIGKGLEEIDEQEYLTAFNSKFQKKWEALSSEKNRWVKRKKIRDYLLSSGFEADLIYEKLKTLD